MDKRPKDLETILSRVDGMLTISEGGYLDRLAQLNLGTGVIVEIRSCEGKPIKWLTLGAMLRGREGLCRRPSQTVGRGGLCG